MDKKSENHQFRAIQDLQENLRNVILEIEGEGGFVHFSCCFKGKI